MTGLKNGKECKGCSMCMETVDGMIDKIVVRHDFKTVYDIRAALIEVYAETMKRCESSPPPNLTHTKRTV